MNICCVIVTKFICSPLSPHELLHVCLQEEKTALHKTISTMNIKDDKTRVAMCKLLLQRKANPNLQNRVSWPPRIDGAVYGIRLHGADGEHGCGCEGVIGMGCDSRMGPHELSVYVCV